MSAIKSALEKLFSLNLLSAEEELRTVVLKMPRNGNNTIFLPPFDHKDMALDELQHVLKSFFREVWGKIIFQTLYIFRC